MVPAPVPLVQAGALGELEMTSKNSSALRTGGAGASSSSVDPMAFFGLAPSPSPLITAPLRKAASVADLKDALVRGRSSNPDPA